MSYLVINEELRIQSCSIADFNSERFAEPLEDPESIAIIYDPGTDTVFLNSDNNNYDFYQMLTDTYLRVDKNKRISIKSQIQEINKSNFTDTFRLLDAVIRIRQQAEVERQVKELKRIFGKQPVDTYFRKFDILDALRKMDEQNVSYNTYMYGYIEGIRAERARRKARAC